MKVERNIEVRLNDTKTTKGAWLLANYPNEFEAGEAAGKALAMAAAQPGAAKIPGAKFAFVIVTTTIEA